MEKENSGLFQIVGGLGIIVVLGTIGYLLSTQSNQKKWSFEDWVQKSDVSLTYFENNDRSNGRVIDGGNWWEFKKYVIDSKESNCLEEVKRLGVLNRSESVRRFPNCRIGTLDYLISEYKKYNPGGSIPYGISGELTISEGGKETKGTNPINTSSTYTNTQKTFTDKNPLNQPTTTQLPPSVPQRNSVTIRTSSGKSYTSTRDYVSCTLNVEPPRGPFVPLHTDTMRIVEEPGFYIRCESSGVIEDLTGKKEHYHGENNCYLQTSEWLVSSRSVWIQEQTWVGPTNDHRNFVWGDWEYDPPKISQYWGHLSCSMGKEFGLVQPLIDQGESYVNSFRLDKKRMTYVPVNQE